jgi:hypothetical protein
MDKSKVTRKERVMIILMSHYPVAYPRGSGIVKEPSYEDCGEGVTHTEL